MTKTLLAGDGFVTTDVLAKALARHATAYQTAAIANGWPEEPMIDIGGVREAQGSEDDLIAALQGGDVCFTHSFPVTSRVLDASASLRLVTVTRGGPVNVDVAAATAHGVLVTYAPGRNATATAEHTVGMILAALRQIPQRHSELLTGVWRGDFYRYDQVGPEIQGATVGLIGFGAIGSRVARAVRSMGAQVVVSDPFVDPTSLDPETELAAELDECWRGPTSSRSTPA